MKNPGPGTVQCTSQYGPSKAAWVTGQALPIACLWLCCAVVFLQGWVSHFAPRAWAQERRDAIGKFASEQRQVPTAAELGKAAEAIKMLFGDTAAAAKTPKSASRLAADVFATRESAETDAEYYGLCLYAITLAGKGSDPALVIAVASDAAKRIDVDAASLALPRLLSVTGAGEPEPRFGRGMPSTARSDWN